MTSKTTSTYRKRLFLVVLTIWAVILLLSGNAANQIVDYGHFFLLGIGGAVVANSTGAGGGIIFIPFFTSLGLAHTESLGTSILIQCFGMTAGAISWLSVSRVAKSNSTHLNNLISQLLVYCGIAAIVGVLIGQYYVVPESDAMLLSLFRMFSIVFGVILIIIAIFSKKQIHTQFDLIGIDLILMLFVSLIGGMLTAWISVGIGEVVAIALILRRYPTMVAILVGVILSSISVLTAAYAHGAIMESVNGSILLFAAPGAIVGGTLAYRVSEKLGPIRLKLFFSLWIIIAGICM